MFLDNDQIEAFKILKQVFLFLRPMSSVPVPVKLPYVLQRMRSLQNSCQQELEHRQELIAQLKQIQREVKQYSSMQN